MTDAHTRFKAHPGDWIHVHGIHGEQLRVGQIVEVLGHPGHEHYRVRWDEEHESIYFPANGAVLVPAEPRRKRT
jgi:hypothetical protein